MEKHISATNYDSKLGDFWKKVLGILETELNPMTFNTWVLKIVPDNLSEKSIDLLLANTYAKKQLQKYTSLIQDAVNKVGKSKFEINYVIRENISVPNEEKDNKPENLGPLFETNKKPKLTNELYLKAGLVPKFKFENFIMGNSNQLAYAIAQAVSEKPGEAYNPFFLYAGVGLGKTHLMQAIGNKILTDNPKANVIYTTGESFMNELIETIQSGKGKGKYTSNEFRNKFRKADVLLIDDIQFIIGREATQLEFFHTFNALYLAGKQIVLTSDRPPKEFVNLEKRITSRFGSGIIADIGQPDADLRSAILRNKRDLNKDLIGNDVIDYIAQNVESNIRELEGAYTQVLTESKAAKSKPSVEFAQAILGKNHNVYKSKQMSPGQIIKTVCKYYSIKSTDIKGKSRTKDLVLPRQIAMYLIKELTDSPLMSIGDALGGRDHTTIMHGIKKIEEEAMEMGKIRQDLINVRQML